MLFRNIEDNKLYLIWQGGNILIQFHKQDEPLTLLDLAKYCVPKDNANISHLWIHASAEMTACRGDVLELEANGYDCLPQYDGDEGLVSLHAYKKPRGKYPRFNIIFLYASQWDWNGLSPVETMRLILKLQDELKVPISGSPSGVGMRYLQKCCEKRPLWLAKPEIDLSQLPWNGAARPLIWQRPPEREELECKYLYAFDKNAAYPRAAMEEKFGYGTPRHVDTDVEEAWCPTTPGIWLVTPHRKATPDSDLLPPLVWKWNEPIWLATPVVKLLLKQEITLTWHEAWIFTKNAYIFRNWIDNLWQFRKGSLGVERAAYKSIMNDTLGLTRSSKLGTDSFKYRPDWNVQVVGGAYAVMHYNIVKFVQIGHYPLICQLDALYYTSNEDVPNLAVPGILDHCESLGGYKLKFKIPMDEIEEGMTVRAILSSLMPQGKKLRLLNRIAERHGY
jgi:hypothetical protein